MITYEELRTMTCSRCGNYCCRLFDNGMVVFAYVTPGDNFILCKDCSQKAHELKGK